MKKKSSPKKYYHEVTSNVFQNSSSVPTDNIGTFISNNESVFEFFPPFW